LPKLAGFPAGMAQKPITAVSSSSEHRDWSYLERGMGSRKAIAGGELFVSRGPSIYQFKEIKVEK